MGSEELSPLRQLARLHGVQTSYFNYEGRWQNASLEHLLGILKLMGAPVVRVKDAASAVRERRQERWREVVEPVVVLWEGRHREVRLRLPSDCGDGRIGVRLDLETGERREWSTDLSACRLSRRTAVEGVSYLVKRLPLPDDLPIGYHSLALKLPHAEAQALVIAAPRRAFGMTGEQDISAWGVFIPLYALRSCSSGGGSSYTDLGRLIDWVSDMGGQVVATLPLLPTFAREPFEMSPYLPLTRLLWNEFYVDVAGSPELASCPAAAAILGSTHSTREAESLDALPLVDYQRQMALKREVVEELSRCCGDGTVAGEQLQDFMRRNPVVEDYARFRALCEEHSSTWQDWPERLRDGRVADGDYDDAVVRYYAYAQWLAHRQVSALSDEASSNGLGLYLDLPLGIHPGGYDMWRNQDLYVIDASVGAPPDAAFTSGQYWAFPPMHPDRLRQEGYRHWIAVLRHHMEHAGVLRIDHVMGLHRLFWVPGGGQPKDGAYVRYPADELYAILSLESTRTHTLLVGEDLGTVPPEVRPAMREHGVLRMYVVQYALLDDADVPLSNAPEDSVASLNTHDMFPFAAFLKGTDIVERERSGVLDSERADRERKERVAAVRVLAHSLGECDVPDGIEPRALLAAALRFLGAGPAQVVLVNLEDLWLEMEAQNLPGTRLEYPNWRRKARFRFEEFRNLPDVVNILAEMNGVRHTSKKHAKLR